MEGNRFNIYEKVYQKLIALEVKEIRTNEFYKLVENIKIPKEDIIELIEEQLLAAGLTVTQVDRISSNLSLKIRWTRRDARNIEKHLREEGLIVKKGYSKIKVKANEN